VGDGERRDAFGNPIVERPASHAGFAPPLAPAPAAAAAGPEAASAAEEPPAPPVATRLRSSGGGHELADGASVALALGVGSLLFWPVAPIAWFYGRRVLRRIDASGGRLGGRGMALGGTVLGAIVTGLIVLGVIGVLSHH